MFNALKSRKVFIALEKALQRKYHVMRIHCEIYLDTVFFGRFLLFFCCCCFLSTPDVRTLDGLVWFGSTFNAIA